VIGIARNTHPEDGPDYSSRLMKTVIHALSIAWTCPESSILYSTDLNRQIGYFGVQAVFAGVWTIQKPGAGV
jgi:hypothetical protein